MMLAPAKKATESQLAWSSVFGISNLDNAAVSPNDDAAFRFDVETSQGIRFTFSLPISEAGRASWFFAKAGQAGAIQTGFRPKEIKVQPLEPQAVTVSLGRKPSELLVHLDLTAFHACYAITSAQARQLAAHLLAAAALDDAEPPGRQ